MSIANADNRHQADIRLGFVGGSVQAFLFHADKTVLIHGWRFLSEVDVPASNADYMRIRLRKLTPAGVRTFFPGEVDTRQGLTVGQSLGVEFDEEMLVEKGDTVEAVYTQVGGGGLSFAHAILDYEVKGN